MAVRVRVLDENAAEVQVVEVSDRGIADRHMDAERCGTRLDDLDGLRVAEFRHEERLRLVLLVDRETERHRLGGAGSLVEHR